MFVISDITHRLDSYRAFFLRLAFKSELLQDYYCTRHKRLLLWFLLTACLQLALAIYFPIPMLIIGPAILGMPHLVASFRHSFGASSKLVFSNHKLQLTISAVLWIGIFLLQAFRLPISPNFVSILAIGGLFILWYITSSNAIKWKWFFLFSLMGLLGLTYLFPYGSAAFLILAHHFVAFLHWIKSAKESKDKAVAFITLFIFSLIHFLIFRGFFDEWINGRYWFNLPDYYLERTFFSWTKSPMLLMRCLVAYALSCCLCFWSRNSLHPVA